MDLVIDTFLESNVAFWSDLIFKEKPQDILELLISVTLIYKIASTRKMNTICKKFSRNCVKKN